MVIADSEVQRLTRVLYVCVRLFWAMGLGYSVPIDGPDFYILGNLTRLPRCLFLEQPEGYVKPQ